MIEEKLTVASVAATAQSYRIALFDLTKVKIPRNNISVTKQTGQEPKHSILRIITGSGTGEKNVRQRIRDGTTAPPLP